MTTRCISHHTQPDCASRTGFQTVVWEGGIRTLHVRSKCNLEIIDRNAFLCHNRPRRVVFITPPTGEHVHHLRRCEDHVDQHVLWNLLKRQRMSQRPNFLFQKSDVPFNWPNVFALSCQFHGRVCREFPNESL